MPIAIDRRTLFRSTGVAGLAAAGWALGTSAGARASTYTGPVRLVANENPYGPSASAQDAMVKARADGWMYATSGSRELRSLIAAKEGVDPNNVLITAGAGELLKMAGLSFGMAGVCRHRVRKFPWRRFRENRKPSSFSTQT